jgi:hypothetical protein
MVVFGDDTEQRPIWAASVKVAAISSIVTEEPCEVLLCQSARQLTHRFADCNNEAVAHQLSKWLRRKGLDKFAGEKNAGASAAYGANTRHGSGCVGLETAVDLEKGVEALV